MKIILKLFSSDTYFNIITKISEGVIGMVEEVVKQWVGTAIGQRWLKWFTDILITRFGDTIVKPAMRVWLVREGYRYDQADAKDRIKKLKAAEGSNDEQVYYDTLNDVFRK